MTAQQLLSFQSPNQTLSSYLLYLPPGARSKASSTWPLIVFLHGAGERGSDPLALKVHGIPRIVEHRPDFPFITVSPQCPGPRSWNDCIDDLAALLDHVMKELPVDAQRVYLTGISMGGAGAWHLGAEYPERFAAVVPICGYGLAEYGFPEKARRLKDVPVWAFHGALDDTVPLPQSEELVRALREAGGNVKLTVYSDAAHDSWTRTYENPALYEWLQQQRKAG